MRVLFGVAVLAAATVATACSTKITDPSQNKTDTFTGTITPAALGGTGLGAAHSFNVPNGGEFTVKVTAMTPGFNSQFAVALYLGSCGSGALVGSTFVALVGVQALTGPIQQTGQYCVQLADIGTMTVAENYTLTVNHP